MDNRTAGIETVSYCSQRYEEVLFFDFAGQDDCHAYGPNQMFLESLLSKPGLSITLLQVIKVTEKRGHLTPVALMSITDIPYQGLTCLPWGAGDSISVLAIWPAEA